MNEDIILEFSLQIHRLRDVPTVITLETGCTKIHEIQFRGYMEAHNISSQRDDDKLRPLKQQP